MSTLKTFAILPSPIRDMTVWNDYLICITDDGPYIVSPDGTVQKVEPSNDDGASLGLVSC